VNVYAIKSAMAAYFERGVDDLIVHDIDLGLVALNQVRMNAELNNDFEFTRRLLTLDVDGVTGGSLDEAVERGTTDVYEIKTVVDVGQFDRDGNFLPVEWTTTSESLSRQRMDNPSSMVRVPTDAEAMVNMGGNRFLFSGNRVYFHPVTPNQVFSVGIEAYTFSRDWVDADTLPEIPVNGNAWLSKGNQYLQWAGMIHLNHTYKGFTFRQEGNLPPPQQLADLGLASLMTWSAFKYEQYRRHTR
jgi:hypothetical protein